MEEGKKSNIRLTPKDNTEKIIVFTVLLLVIIMVGSFFIKQEKEIVDDTPKVGEMWEHYGTGNPNNEDEIFNRKVLLIKDGYVKFVSNDRDTLSVPMAVFKYHSKKIE